MKNVIYFLFFAFAIPSFAQTHIPDKNFADAIREKCPTCIDGNDNLTVEAASLDSLFLANKNISSLEGIEGFTNLKKLICNSNNLTHLPQLPQSLLVFTCDQNNLINLPQIPKSLTLLNCGNNKLISLPELPQSLKTLACYQNELISLPQLPKGLVRLYCEINQLDTLPELPNSLEEIKCFRNLLSSLPSLPLNLKKLYCHNNILTLLPQLPPNLIYLSCPINKLKSLPKLPESLEEIKCFSNQLSSLPQLPQNLKRLFCEANQLTSLPQIPQNLIYLYCSSNLLSSIPELPKSLEYLDCENNKGLNCFNGLLPFDLVDLNILNTNIKCLPNIPIALVNTSSLPICDSNNSNNCFFVSIKEAIEIPLNVYPNPSSDRLFVETNIAINGTLTLSNLLGQVFDYQLFKSSEVSVLDIQHLPKGVYILTLKTDKGNVSRRVVKE